MDFFTQDTWKFINTFAPWLSALGTFLVVLLTLHLARRDKNIRLDIGAGHRIIITPGVQGPPPEYLCIYIVNVGHREAQITNIGWKVGILKKRHAIQQPMNDGMSSSIPVRLKDGEEARYFIPLDDGNDWLERFVKDMSFSFPLVYLQCKFIKVRVFTSIGKSFESVIEKNLHKEIIKKTKELNL